MAYSSEHETMTDPQMVNTSQSEGEQTIVKRVNEMLGKAKKFRKRYDKDWHDNYEFVMGGKQWPVERARWRFNEAVNLAWSAIMTEIGIQTDAKPKFEFMSQEATDEPFMEVLRSINDRNWEKYGWNNIVQSAMFDSKLYHVGHALVEWDPYLDNGLGDVSIKMLDPYYCYWDPIAQDVNTGKRARYFIYAEPVPVSELKDRYPDKADKIKADVDFLSKDSNGGANSSRVYTNYDPYSPSRLPSGGNKQSEMYGGEEMTMLIRAWLRDESLEEVEEDCSHEGSEDEVAEQKKEYILRKKYPTGRYIEIASNTLLRDGPPGVEINGEWVPYLDPYCADHFPIVKVVNYSYSREYAGENEVTHIKGPQKIVNYIWSYILDSFRMMANPKIVISTSSGIDPDLITNEPGLKIETNDMNGFRQEPGQAIASGSFDLLTQAETFLDKIQGLQDVSRGAEQAGVNSGIMLEGYIEAAQTRPRLKNRNLESFLQGLGQLVCARYLQFYDKPRTFRITNKDGFPEYIEFYMPEIIENGRIAKVVRLKTDGSGQIISQDVQNMEVKGVPDIKITSGSALPFAKAQKADTALKYLNAGAIDQEEMLKVVDWPNWEQVIKRMKEAAVPAEGAPPAA